MRPAPLASPSTDASSAAVPSSAFSYHAHITASSDVSNFSAAGGEILKLFTHRDRFGASVTLPAGSSRVEPGAVPSSDVTLSWSTFSDAAAEAGISRRYGGIHFEQGDLDARATGRIAARLAWERARDYWEGG